MTSEPNLYEFGDSEGHAGDTFAVVCDLFISQGYISLAYWRISHLIKSNEIFLTEVIFFPKYVPFL